MAPALLLAIANSYDPSMPEHRTFHKTQAPYILPNDQSEQQRLEIQSQRLRQLLGGKVFHAPITTSGVSKAMDVGCGTGVITHELAQTFPHARVFGVDLTPVPAVREKLPNIEYVLGDFMALSDSAPVDERFERETVDYIFSRLLILGMDKWPEYVQRCVSLAKPGAWIEMHEYDMMSYRIPDNLDLLQSDLMLPKTMSLAELQQGNQDTDKFMSPYQWNHTLAKLAAAKGINVRAGHDLPSLFEAAGLDDIQITRYVAPFGMWKAGGLSDAARKMAPQNRGFIQNLIPMLLRKLYGEVGKSLVSAEEVERAAQSAIKRAQNWDAAREWMFLYVVRGRSPIKSS